jgi:ABC-type Mn2+/Zn2+ transport system permease subunit
MQDQIAELNKRVAWLERKMVRVLWALISISSAFVGFMVAYNIDSSFGWPSIVLAIGIWLVLAFVVQRQEFKGAPRHIEFIDP